VSSVAEREANENGAELGEAPPHDGADGAAAAGASPEEALRALPEQSARLLAELETVRELEREKRTKRVSSPEFHALADEILDRSRQVFRYAEREEETGDRTNPGEESIDDVAGHSRS
jgi:hypothetical protein